MRPCLGVLVGGRARRMGGIAKGLIDAGEGESIVARFVRLGHALDLEVVLVGSGDAYDTLALPRIADATSGAGPLGGLVSLLAHADGRDVLLLGCDLPEVASSVIERLAALPPGTSSAPRKDGTWQPMVARFASSALAAARARLASEHDRDRSLRALLDEVGAIELELDDGETSSLDDLDTPEDLARFSARIDPMTRLAELTDEAIDVAKVVAAVEHPSAGATALFLGTVRDHADGRAVTLLEYEAYRPMAIRELKACVARIEKSDARGELRLSVVHRLGALRVGDVAVVCAASSPHRSEAFAACRALIDSIKSTVPIWKREHGPEGAYWVGWRDARCDAEGHHDAHHHDTHVHDEPR